MSTALNSKKQGRIQAFKFACSSYQANRNMLEKLEVQDTEKSDAELLAEASAKGGYARAKTDLLIAGLQKSLLQDSIDAVEKPLEQIERRFGKEAREIVAEKYISGIPAKELAEKRGITLSMLYRRMARWLNAVL